MAINSPFGKFVGVLDQVVQKARDHSSALIGNEAMTRATLIDPILQALGWDTANPTMVELERTYLGTRLDYALKNYTGNVQWIIEAKALSVNLDDPLILRSIVNYLFTYRMSNALILTDGITWRHYTRLDPINSEFDSINLKTSAPVECAKFLVNKLDALVYWDRPIVNTVIVPPIQTTPPVTVLDWKLLSGLTLQAGDKAPKSLRLPDGSTCAVRSWRDVLHQSVLFVMANQPGLALPVRDSRSGSVCLIDFNAPGNDVAYRSATYLGQPVYIYENYDARNCVANANMILGRLPEEKKTIAAAVSF
jgi:hypothetical protein